MADLEAFDVAVVGGGAAGRLCARSVGRALRASGGTVVLLEAAPLLGGRVKQLRGVAPWPLEAGPEFVHGAQGSVLVDILREAGAALSEREWPDVYHLAGKGAVSEADPDVAYVHEAFEAVKAAPRPEPDVSMCQWMRDRGATPAQLALAESCYANDFGAPLALLGVRELQDEGKAWTYGEEYLVADRSLGVGLTEHLAHTCPPNVALRCGWPVAAVAHHPAGGATLRKAGGGQTTVRARVVVIAVPLPVLRDGDIEFRPPLPAAKLKAARSIRMGNAVKVFLAFRECFWPPDTWDVVCTGGIVPEFWMTSYPREPGARRSNAATHCVTCFLAGAAADEASALPKETLVERCVAQLDGIYGTAAVPAPARRALVGFDVVDWSKERYVRGAYSYPSLGATAEDRAALAAPVGSRIFFAGEATHRGVNPCLQAALETGARAASEALATLSALRELPARPAARL